MATLASDRRAGGRRLLALVAGLAAVVSTAGAGAWSPTPAGAAPAPPAAPTALAASAASTQAAASYVALGDSFTAGPLIPDQELDPLGCLRSDRDYPHVLVPSTGQPAFRDVSCSGAKTDHMFNAQNVTPGPNPPQLDALDADTRLVTLGIGGNDIGFSSIIQDCVTALPWQTPCRDRYTGGGTDEISARIAATAPKVAAVLDAIHARSPQAEVLVVGYPTILPDSGSGCWPQMPIGWNDVSYLRAKHRELNAMLATQAGAHGATYVDVYTPSIGHDACRSSSTRWVEPIVPATAAAPVHPNARGMSAMAGVIRTAL